MKLKLDENLGERGRSQLQHAGRDVATVLEQALPSATDTGIAVLRLPDKPCAADLEAVVRTLTAGLAGAQAQPSLPLGEIRGHLWIVERGRIRLFDEPDIE